MQKGIKYFWKKDLHKAYLSNDRFNLLHLEPGEIYFEDFSVYYYSSEFKEEQAVKRKQKGRLKICSQSVLFEPLDSDHPIIKFLYRNIVHIGKWSSSVLSKLEQQGEIIVIESKVCISMKESNTIAPYQYVREKRRYFFSLNFVNLNGVLPQIEQLLRANTLNPRESADMVNTIVESRQANMKFNASLIEDLYEKIIHETTASKIQPLVCNPGHLLLTSKQLYFQAFNNVETEPVVKVRLSTIKFITKRRYLLRHVGIEILLTGEKNDVYFIFQSTEDRDKMYNRLIAQEDLNLDEEEQDNMTLKWQSGALSNFDYLMYLNSKADRSFSDLTQYPVFPWVVSDYTSDVLDLENPETFRDLSKPMGAIDEQRLKQLKDRSSGMPEPRFLYGSHYSSPGFVLFYLVRVAPEYVLCLQNGKFDHPDRLFNSISATWNNCCTGHSDYKELIPEFYNSNGQFLCNTQRLKLGMKQNGDHVNHVQLPPWAKDPCDFVTKCREALECDYVSKHINNWIDLIFGYKQRGEEAWKANNVFYYLTYEGAIDLDSVENINDRKCYESQILEFGQTPKQLFHRPHPKRQTGVIPTSLGSVVFESSDEKDEKSEYIPVVQLDENIVLEVGLQSSPLQWLEKLTLKTASKLHKDSILGLSITSDGKHIFSVSQDNQLKMFSVSENEQIRSMNLCNMSLSCCCLIGKEKHILIGSWDNNIYTYSIDYARAINTTHVHDDAVTRICCSSGGTVITTSWDSTVKIWKCVNQNNKPSLTFVDELDHDTEVICCDVFSEEDDGSHMSLVSGTKDGTLSIWNVALMMAVYQMPLHGDEITEVLFNPAGNRILSCSLDQHMKVLDVATEIEIFSKDIGEGIRCACWDGQTVVCAGESGDVMVWNLIKGICLSRLKSHQGPVHSMVLCEKEKVLGTGGRDGYLAIWTL